jgi:hypothetical protein
MTGMLCWCCGEEPIRSIDFDDGERVVRFSHNCRVLAVAKQRVREARHQAGKNAERMAVMELLLRELEDGELYDREDEPAARGCRFQVECKDAPKDDVNRASRPCWRCRRRALLAAIDLERDFEGTTFSAVLDADTCPACRETDGQEGKPAPHPGCTNPNGCRCSASV